jgi:HK97 family phage major capsid protein
MKIRLTSEWVNGEDSYPAGTQLGLEDVAAKALVAEGKAVDVLAEATEKKAAEAQDTRTATIVEKAVSNVLAKFPTNDAGKFVTVLEPVEKDTKSGYANLSEFYRDLMSAGTGKGHAPQVSSKLAAWNTKVTSIMQEGDDEQGGYLVPVEFMPELLKVGLEQTVVYGQARHISMARNRKEIPGTEIPDHSTTGPEFYGGARVYWEEEAGQKTTSKPKLRKVQMHLHKLIGLVPVTDELMEDSAIGIGSVITPIFVDAIRWMADDSFINGNGVGKPLGILNCGSLVTVARSAPNTIAKADVDGMYEALHVTNARSVCWLANRFTFTQLTAIVQGNVPLMVPASAGIASIAGSPVQSIHGYPIKWTEKCSALGTTGDIILTDLSQYFVGEKAGGIDVQQSIHLWFDYDLTAFRFVLRLDGKCAWNKALKYKDGNSASPFVVLS